MKALNILAAVGHFIMAGYILFGVVELWPAVQAALVAVVGLFLLMMSLDDPS